MTKTGFHKSTLILSRKKLPRSIFKGAFYVMWIYQGQIIHPECFSLLQQASLHELSSEDQRE